MHPNSYAAVLVGTWKNSDPVSLKSVNFATYKWREHSFSSSLRKVLEGSILDGFWGRYRAGSQKPGPANSGFGFCYLRYSHDDLLCLVKRDALEKLSQQCRLQPISSVATASLRYNVKHYRSESEHLRRQPAPRHQRRDTRLTHNTSRDRSQAPRLNSAGREGHRRPVVLGSQVAAVCVGNPSMEKTR